MTPFIRETHAFIANADSQQFVAAVSQLLTVVCTKEHAHPSYVLLTHSVCSQTNTNYFETGEILRYSQNASKYKYCCKFSGKSKVFDYSKLNKMSTNKCNIDGHRQ